MARDHAAELLAILARDQQLGAERKAAEAEKTPVARYLTVANAIVEITHRTRYVDDPELLDAVAHCLGCTTSERFNNTEPLWGSNDVLAANTATARAWAQKHAETCRAIPMDGPQ